MQETSDIQGAKLGVVMGIALEAKLGVVLGIAPRSKTKGKCWCKIGRSSWH